MLQQTQVRTFQLSPDAEPVAGESGKPAATVEPQAGDAVTKAERDRLAQELDAARTSLKQLQDTHKGTVKELDRVRQRGVTPEVIEAFERAGLDPGGVKASLTAWASEAAKEPEAEVATAAEKPLTAAAAEALFERRYVERRRAEIVQERERQLGREAQIVQDALTAVPEELRADYAELVSVKLAKLTGRDDYGWLPAQPDQIKAAVDAVMVFRPVDAAGPAAQPAARNLNPTAEEARLAGSGPKGGPGGPGAVLHEGPQLDPTNMDQVIQFGIKSIEAKRAAREAGRAAVPASAAV